MQGQGTNGNPSVPFLRSSIPAYCTFRKAFLSLQKNSIKRIDLYGWNVLYALKGQKHLAQGNTLGKAMLGCRPVRAKAFYIRGIFMLLPLQGVSIPPYLPRALPWARCFWAFSPFQPYRSKEYGFR